MVYGETGTFIFPTIAQGTADMTPSLVVGWLLIFAALGFKIGAVPLHSWIPDTYQGAPTPITAFLSIAPKGAAFAILLRMFFSTLAAFKPQWVWLMIGMAMLSMLYGNIVAIAQRNIKRLLAYSGIAQIGSIVISLYYYLVVVKKMYISEPSNPTPITVSGALQAVIYVGLAGTLILGIWPKPFMAYTVAATTIFSNMDGSAVATTLP